MPPDSYQDISRTILEPDKAGNPPSGAVAKPFEACGFCAWPEAFAGLERLGRGGRVLWLALSGAEPREAAHVCTWALEAMAAGMPDHDPFGQVRADAAFWADVATPAEIEAYVCAGLRVAGHKVRGLSARKRLLVAIWNSLGAEDRAAFLARVRGGN